MLEAMFDHFISGKLVNPSKIDSELELCYLSFLLFIFYDPSPELPCLSARPADQQTVVPWLQIEATRRRPLAKHQSAGQDVC